MRTLLVLGLIAGAAFMAGWFTIERDGDSTRIEINKSEIRGDTRHAIDRGKEYLDRRERERMARQDQRDVSVGEQRSDPGEPYYLSQPDDTSPRDYRDQRYFNSPAASQRRNNGQPNYRQSTDGDAYRYRDPASGYPSTGGAAQPSAAPRPRRDDRRWSEVPAPPWQSR